MAITSTLLKTITFCNIAGGNYRILLTQSNARVSARYFMIATLAFNQLMEVTGETSICSHLILHFLHFVGNKAKGRILKWVSQENKTHQVFRKTNIFLPPNAHTCVGVSEDKKCSFFGKFGMLCFLVTPVLRLALLPCSQRSPTFTKKMNHV